MMNKELLLVLCANSLVSCYGVDCQEWSAHLIGQAMLSMDSMLSNVRGL